MNCMFKSNTIERFKKNISEDKYNSERAEFNLTV